MSNKHHHPTAFCLIWYACDKCGHRERVWNSRDSWIEKRILCSSCGWLLECTAPTHVYAPDHTPYVGQGIWKNGTHEEAVLTIRRRMEKVSERAINYIPVDMRASYIDKYLQNPHRLEFTPGWPMFYRHGYTRDTA